MMSKTYPPVTHNCAACEREFHPRKRKNDCYNKCCSPECVRELRRRRMLSGAWAMRIRDEPPMKITDVEAVMGAMPSRLLAQYEQLPEDQKAIVRQNWRF